MSRSGRGRVAAVLVVAGVVTSACGDETPGEGFGAAVTTSPSTSSTPFAGTTIAQGEVVAVDNLDGARLQPVEDGVVRSFETSVEVTEIGWADELGSGEYGYRAEGDANLVVFSVTVESNDRETPQEGAVVAAVAVDDQQREVPGFESTVEEGGDASYAVAVPEDRRSVELELKYGGVVQSLDLIEGKPAGERPDALYRAASGSVVYTEALTPASFDVDVYGDGFSTKYTVTVHSAELGYFPMHGSQNPSGQDKGWLTLWVGSDATPSTCSAPLSAYSFEDDKGTVYQAAQPASDIPEPGLIDTPTAVVAFEVPADLAKGTLSVSAPQVTCQVSTSTYEPVPARGVAVVAVAPARGLTGRRGHVGF